MRNKRSKHYLGLIYTALILFLLFFAPFRQGTNTDVNLIPFASFAEMLSPYFLENEFPSWHYTGHTIYNILGNLLLFAPIPILFEWKHGVGLIVLIAITVPVIVEFLQYLFQVGSANVDDILLNGLGFLIGYRVVKNQFKSD